MNSNDFKTGDILQATSNEKMKGYYPIVFVSGHSENNFVGAMITHEAIPDKNVKMIESHFESEFPLGFDDTYLVIGRFIKPKNWGPFYKKGQLTEEGWEFVKDKIKNCPSETFANYFARHAKRNKTNR